VRHKLFNPYKQKRRWGRGVKRASRFVSTRNQVYTGSNPYQQEKKGVDWRKRIKVIILILALLVMVVFVLFHPFFHIKNQNITGLQRINETEFREAVFGMIDYKKFFIFPGRDYLLINVEELEAIIKDRFSIESIIIKKVFPDTLNIQIEEKISTIIYDNGEKYNYLGLEGKIVEILRKVGNDEWQEVTEIVTSTNVQGEEIEKKRVIERTHKPTLDIIIKELGDYPLVYDKRGFIGEINTQVLQPETVQGVIAWFNLINKRTDIPFGYIIIENELGNAIITTREGWSLLIKLSEDVEIQFEELQYLLREKIKKINRSNLNYIDLRFPGRVYWQ